MLKVHKIIEKTDAEGPGTRYCIWVQGCPHMCKGCFNPETWDESKGFEIESDTLIQKILNTTDIEGITLLGGEPFVQARELSRIAEKLKQYGLSVLTFSGYTYMQLLEMNDYYVNKLLSHTDLLIDGKYIESLTDYSRPWTGSSNQNFVFLSDKYCKDDLKKYKNKVEIRIDKNGSIILNGMGDYKKIEKLICQKGLT